MTKASPTLFDVVRSASPYNLNEEQRAALDKNEAELAKARDLLTQAAGPLAVSTVRGSAALCINITRFLNGEPT